jgi:hypothetical protein
MAVAGVQLSECRRTAHPGIDWGAMKLATLGAVFAVCLLLIPLSVVLVLELLGVSTLPGLYLLALPAELLWDAGYRGSLVDWGDGWVWLTPPGIALVYGPIVAILSGLLYRLLRGHRGR